MEASISLLLGLLAFCMLSMDLVLSIVYRRLSHHGRATALIVFAATSLALVFFQILDSWSALSFTQGVYRILGYVWTGLVIADGAFLVSFVPYYTTWIIGHRWSNPYKTVFPLISALFAGFSIAGTVSPHPVFGRLSFCLCLFTVLFSVIVMFKNMKGIESRDIRILVLTTFIVVLSMMPVILAGLFVPFIRAISTQIFFLAYSIVLLVFLFLGISHMIHDREADRQPPAQKVDLSMYHITDREAEVIDLVGQGLTNKEIAASLSLSVNTVNNHIANIFGKTGVRSRIDLLNLIHKGIWQ